MPSSTNTNTTDYCTLPLQEAFSASISSGKFVDTKIILFTRRDFSGSVCKPRALYASSHVLKTVPYFNDRKLRPPASPRAYSADNPLRVLFGTFAESELQNFSESPDKTECAESYGYCSDSDLEEEEDFTNSKETPKRTRATVRGHPFDPLCFPLAENKPAYAEYKENLEKGKVIRIQDMAFITQVSRTYTTVTLTT